MSRDIYQILESLDAAQKSVKQLPALFKPKNTSPQISGPYPGDNATRGYLVGEGEDEQAPRFRDEKDYKDQRDRIYRLLVQPDTDLETRESAKAALARLAAAAKQQGINEQEQRNPMAQAVTRRIAHAHPEWITRYGVETVLQAIEDVTEGEKDWEEIGSSDVSAYVDYVKSALDDRMGDRSEMDDRQPFAEEISDKQEYNQVAAELNTARETGDLDRVKQLSQRLMDLGGGSVEIDMRGQIKPVNEAQATEDILSTMKKKLGDYLQDVATAIKIDPDLKDKIPDTLDDIKSVKTITTDDGKEIKIHGNEDDGFRISIKNTQLSPRFDNLDEAVMACEMYCARRRTAATNADYVEEKRT